MTSKEPQQQTLEVLAQRIELHQPLRHRHRLRAAARRVSVLGDAGEDPRSERRLARALLAQPLIESLDLEVEADKKLAAVETGGALQDGRVGRFAKGGEFQGVSGEEARIKPDRLGFGHQQARRPGVQLAAQRDQALAQALARLGIEAVAPQEIGQLLAARPVIRMHRQIGDQCARLTRGDSHRQRRHAFGFGGERAEQAQDEACVSLHGSATGKAHVAAQMQTIIPRRASGFHGNEAPAGRSRRPGIAGRYRSRPTPGVGAPAQHDQPTTNLVPRTRSSRTPCGKCDRSTAAISPP